MARVKVGHFRQVLSWFWKRQLSNMCPSHDSKVSGQAKTAHMLLAMLGKGREEGIPANLLASQCKEHWWTYPLSFSAGLMVVLVGPSLEGVGMPVARLGEVLG